MRGRQKAGVAVLGLATLALSGCQLLYFLGGKGKQEAAYQLPKNTRVLVWVDPRASSGTPVDVPTLLGDRIRDHLYQWKAADSFVLQARVTELRKDPAFERMGVADAAQRLDADVVLYVDLIQFRVQSVSEGQLTQGFAEALVKVVDKEGVRLWPPANDTLGVPIKAVAQVKLADDASPNAVKAQLLEDLTIRAARYFHPYDLENKSLTR